MTWLIGSVEALRLVAALAENVAAGLIAALLILLARRGAFPPRSAPWWLLTMAAAGLAVAVLARIGVWAGVAAWLQLVGRA